MSQRTRAANGHATPTPAKKPRARRATTAPTATAPTETAPKPGAEPVSGEEIARVLRAVAGELERDPALARRVAEAMGGKPPTPASASPAPLAPVEEGQAPEPAAPVAHDGAHEPDAGETGAPEMDTPPAVVGRSFRPRLVTGLAPDLGPGVPDPFTLRARLGEAGLRAALADLRLGTLRAMVREHALDPTGRLKGVNDAAKLRAAILAAARARAGDHP
ncbi:MAG TPA: hypothetical protein VFY89_05025 [Ktedonobacterales bacterium]